MEKPSFFWFRRDLRLMDNVGLAKALDQNKSVIPVFIFDKNILSELPNNDARVSFIHQLLEKINVELNTINSSLLIKFGNPEKIWE